MEEELVLRDNVIQRDLGVELLLLSIRKEIILLLYAKGCIFKNLNYRYSL